MRDNSCDQAKPDECSICKCFDVCKYVPVRAADTMRLLPKVCRWYEREEQDE